MEETKTAAGAEEVMKEEAQKETPKADKKKAKKGKWRTPEATLLGVGFCGGALGALFAMNTLRHKTKHWYFWVVNVIGLILHAVIAVWLVLYF